MATRFAVKTGVWSDTTVWDSGALPIAGDVIYPNGFTVTLDQDISVDGLNNNAPTVYLTNLSTPAMTNNNLPSGLAFSSSYIIGAEPYKVFDQISGTYWQSNTINSGTIAYTFPTSKIIKRYYFNSYGSNTVPKNFTFEGSNDNFSTFTILDNITGNVLNSFVSTNPTLLANTTSFTSYRLNILTASFAGYNPRVDQFDMTESNSTVYGSGSGGTFTVPSTLSGIRNITFTGRGLISSNGITSTLLNLDNNLTNVVNLNKTSGAYIINPLFVSANSPLAPTAININNNGIININGDIFAPTTTDCAMPNGLIRIVSNSTTTINGSIYALAGRSNVTSYTINMLPTSTNATFTINGDVIGGNLYSNTYSIFVQSVNIINIFGNLTSNIGYCYYSTTASFLNLTGTATVTNLNSVPSVVMTSATSLFTMNGAITNKGNTMAIQIQKMRYVSTATPYWIFQTNGASDMTLSYGTPVTGAYPTEADVKLGVAYAASPTRYGTCAVPLPQYVSQGVATGATIGTAYINAADVWNVLSSSITTAGSIGERLKVASTVESTGDQLAAYIV